MEAAAAVAAVPTVAYEVAELEVPAQQQQQQLELPEQQQSLAIEPAPTNMLIDAQVAYVLLG